MSEESNVLRFPGPGEKVECQIRFPNVSSTLDGHEDYMAGFVQLAAELQIVSELFEELGSIFDECEEADFQRGTHFVDGSVVFSFTLPRRYLSRVKEMGFEVVEEA